MAVDAAAAGCHSRVGLWAGRSQQLADGGKSNVVASGSCSPTLNQGTGALISVRPCQGTAGAPVTWPAQSPQQGLQGTSEDWPDQKFFRPRVGQHRRAGPKGHQSEAWERIGHDAPNGQVSSGPIDKLAGGRWRQAMYPDRAVRPEASRGSTGWRRPTSMEWDLPTAPGQGLVEARYILVAYPVHLGPRGPSAYPQLREGTARQRSTRHLPHWQP